MTTGPITRLLIANRGEIAARIIRSAHALGLATVAVYSDPDAEAPYVTQADEAADRARTAAIEAQIEAESHSFFVTARQYDDGIIDPRDTRTVLGLALSAVHNAPVAGRRGFGVFRM